MRREGRCKRVEGWGERLTVGENDARKVVHIPSSNRVPRPRISYSRSHSPCPSSKVLTNHPMEKPRKSAKFKMAAIRPSDNHDFTFGRFIFATNTAIQLLGEGEQSNFTLYSCTIFLSIFEESTVLFRSTKGKLAFSSDCLFCERERYRVFSEAI